MKDNYFIIHGSFGTPYSNWFPWLHSFLTDAGKEAYVPDFPIGVGYQNYENWSNLLKVYLNSGLINKNTVFIAHSIAPVFVSKFLIENKIKVKKLIFVCGFNDYFGIDESYDAVNGSMYTDSLEKVKEFSNEIICFYSDNDPYVKYEKEKEFADIVGAKQILLSGSGHINSETGYNKFEEIVDYLF